MITSPFQLEGPLRHRVAAYVQAMGKASVVDTAMLDQALAARDPLLPPPS